MLVGRDREVAALDELMRHGRAGVSGAVLVRGEPGIGKTALLDDLAGRSGDATLLRTRGSEVESVLAFAALHRLLRPIIRLRDELALPQARALRVALGEEEGAVEPFLVGVAVLGLITAAAEEQLVLCLVDDAQWLDQASADALLFATNRLGADRVIVVSAVRDGVPSRFDRQGLTEMVVTGVDAAAARQLLHGRVGLSLAEEVTDRLVVETKGNPLALLEIPKELTGAQLEGAAPLPAQLHLPERVEEAFLGQVRALPAPVQSVLLLVAADEIGRVSVLAKAGEEVDLPDGALEDAVASGLLSRDGDFVSLRHPLVRSAVYQAASWGERRAAHLALAAALAVAGEPDRAVWQRALGARGHDDELAAELDRVGRRAARRGAAAAALSAFERAASLCSEPHARAGLTLAAAQNAWNCGRVGAAEALLTAAAEAGEEPVHLADVARLRGHIEVNVGSAAAAHRIFSDAARAVQHADPLRALELAVLAATLRAYGAEGGAPIRADDLQIPISTDSVPRTRCLREMFTAMTLTAEEQWPAAVAALDRALLISEDVDDREVLWNLGNAALQLGDDQAQLHCYSRALADARASGAVTAVVYALQRLCFSYWLAGDLTAVRSAAEEALSLASSIGRPALTAPLSVWLAFLAVVQGPADYEDLAPQLDTAVVSALGIFADPVHDLAGWARGIHAASAGDQTDALHHLSDFRVAALKRMASVDRLDAAVRAEELELARTWANELEVFAAGTGRAWAAADVAYGKALAGATEDRDDNFQSALHTHATAGRPLDEARVELAYGEWLRRTQRRVEARTHLRAALGRFTDARIAPFAERAADELRASGETARKRDPSTAVQLTPMELKIASLVRSGRSNKDVAAECWVSPRTVAFHLRNVFTKAGITSRTELARLDLV